MAASQCLFTPFFSVIYNGEKVIKVQRSIYMSISSQNWIRESSFPYQDVKNDSQISFLQRRHVQKFLELNDGKGFWDFSSPSSPLQRGPLRRF